MSSILQRVNVLATCLLGGVLASILVAQVLPRTPRPIGPKQAKMEAEWIWPDTLQVVPSQPGDAVKLVRIIKGDHEIIPGESKLPALAGDLDGLYKTFDAWLNDVSFVVQNQTERPIVAVGVSVVLPVRQTGMPCLFNGEREPGLAPDPWCDQHPHWCDGGCPLLVIRNMQWGRIPPEAATGLVEQLRAQHSWTSPVLSLDVPLEARTRLAWPSGQAVELSPAGRVDGMSGATDPRGGFPNVLNGILGREGIAEAQDEDPCEARANSRTGCAFAEVSKFNIAVDVVYFGDGTLWGNYGYGYALPTPDGIFRRVDARDFPGAKNPTSKN